MNIKNLTLISLLGLGAILFMLETVVAEPSPFPPSQSQDQQTPSIEPSAGDSSTAQPPPPDFNEALAAAAGDMDDAVRLSPSKSEILHLEQDAASVIVSNPAHAAVMLDSPRVLIILPRAPGATSFTVLDRKGNTILEKKVIVSSGREPFVRVRKICNNASGDCAASSYYYCPDGCYEVSTDAISQTSSGAVPEIPAAGSTDTATDDAKKTPETTGDEGEEEIPLETDEPSLEGVIPNAPPPPALPDAGGEE